MARVLFADVFLDKRAEVASAKVRKRIDVVLHYLESMPNYGTRAVPRSVQHRFGKQVRKITVAPYQIIYSFDPKADVVYVSDLLYTPSIHGS